MDDDRTSNRGNVVGSGASLSIGEKIGVRPQGGWTLGPLLLAAYSLVSTRPVIASHISLMRIDPWPHFPRLK